MPLITHLNYTNPNNEIYCCLRNKVVELHNKQVEQFCSGCKMFAGNVGGQGVACIWEDVRDVSNPHIVRNPHMEFASNQIKQVPLEGPSNFLFGQI